MIEDLTIKGIIALRMGMNVDRIIALSEMIEGGIIDLMETTKVDLVLMTIAKEDITDLIVAKAGQEEVMEMTVKEGTIDQILTVIIVLVVQYVKIMIQDQ